ncbi:MAG: glycosyltransferase [Prevotella sp.]|nr:glycosyltransferase [Candidatus Prevotella equi]
MATVTPDITILMSTYNRRKYLPSMLKDLQAQTFTNWRLIVVNDGGDDVEDIVKSFNDDRMEYYNRPHLGKPAQLNFALRMVESKYIGYLDDDDNVLPEHFSLLYEAAEKNNADFVYTNAQIVTLDKEEQVTQIWPVDDSDAEWTDIRIHNKINHSTILHTKSLADKIGEYDERMRILIDFDYIKRLAAVAKPIHIHTVTYRWYLRQDNNGQYRSISGLWEKDPEAAGRSLIAFFEKDPEALSISYLQNFQIAPLQQECESHKQQVQELTKRIEEANNHCSDLERNLANLQSNYEQDQKAFIAEIHKLQDKKTKHLKIIRLLIIGIACLVCSLFISILSAC